MRKISHELKEGDTLKMRWAGSDKTIKGFKPYNGPFDFVERIAIFTDNTGMSIEKGHYYELAD